MESWRRKPEFHARSNHAFLFVALSGGSSSSETAEDDKTEEGSAMNGVVAPQTGIPPILEQYLERIAKTGEEIYVYGRE